MYQPKVRNPAASGAPSLAADVREAMWRVFCAVGEHWDTVTDPAPLRSRFDSFLDNRIALIPLYVDYYGIARRVVERYLEEASSDEKAAFDKLFTADVASTDAPLTEEAVARQFVAAEFIVLHTALVGFLSFGPLNWPGYFGGANVPGQPAPYRPK